MDNNPRTVTMERTEHIKFKRRLGCPNIQLNAALSVTSILIFYLSKYFFKYFNLHFKVFWCTDQNFVRNFDRLLHGGSENHS